MLYSLKVSAARPWRGTIIQPMQFAQKSAEQAQPRLIIATHGRGKLAQVALGSVASEFLSCVDIPIFVVGPGAQHSTRQMTPRRILHPVSLAGDFRRSVCLALDLAQLHRGELTLLHVVDPDVQRQINPERTLSWTERALRYPIPPTQPLRFATQIQMTSGMWSKRW
jgi:nucleotide-binding universal stress UspA family protein